ncbi:hypothetical protein E2C01_007166 [Portunus trituberculatus]|uniref:Uncharacterized protein n=1 Tax=Portunus trituberculatus TaxID=210409 RepID=A0A5B7CZS0_PORTR|nr:hypothetical protein [Portunus trituberculatus]
MLDVPQLVPQSLLGNIDNLISDPKDMAHIFVTSFASVYTTSSGLPQFPHQIHDGSFQQIHFTVNDILEILNNMDISSAMGPDLYTQQC